MLQITSLKVIEKVTPEGNIWEQDVPFLGVNATFRITDDEHFFERTKAEAEDYREVLTVDNTERYKSFLLNACGFEQFKYDGYGKAFIHNDPVFVYLEKFSTFTFREYVADSPVTRSIIAELRYYKDHGKLPSVYRHAEEYIVISHFHSLDRYWD
jgi:hypothetical protein